LNPTHNQEPVSAASLGHIAARIAQGLGFQERLLMTWRPRICPFHRLVEHVPQDCRVLDIGCGNGLWLLLLAELNRIREGIGVDISPQRIQTAQRLRGTRSQLRFLTTNPGDPWPTDSVDCVTMIDVVHHVPPQDHKAFVEKAAQTTASRMIIKDIDPAAKFKSAANTLHDLVLSRQRPRYCRPDDLCRWLSELGFAVRLRQRCDMLWYSHFLIVADRI
jgi:2-polyprenyl-3-methyl-5-hydroxy-6-metoxy-1,4-benzoquinol methylase